jgi:alanine racemase
MRATRAVIHLDYLRDNIDLVRKKTGVSICVPVKADAYGHGALRIARTALAAGARYLAVATVAEAEELREGGISAPILLLSVPIPEEIPRIIDAALEVLAGDAEYIDALAEAARSVRRGVAVHLKVDTGMGRIGCRPEEAGKLAAHIADQGFFLAGTATHLAVSDSTAENDRAFTAFQLDRFRTALEGIRALGIDPGIIHAANTGAVTFHEDAWFDMVRPGILLYGYAPPDGKGKPSMPVKPLMELESRIVFVKKIRKGESVSYGRIWTAPEDTFVGTIPAGYADGVPRQLSGKWELYVDSPGQGSLRPLVGRICMDQCMVDLGPSPAASRWDRIVVFGGPAPDAGVLASRVGTIPYEICCNINKRVPRVYSG